MSNYIPEETTQKILDISKDRLFDVINNYIPLKKTGASFSGRCPKCQAENKFSFHPGKGIYTCHICGGIKGNDAVGFVMQHENKSYLDALRSLASILNIFIDDTPKVVKSTIQKGKKGKKVKPDEVPKVKSFCQRMLLESGLEASDLSFNTLRTSKNKTVTDAPVFRPGTLYYNEIRAGDDVIIEYYDLEGLPVKYDLLDAHGKHTGKMKEYCRVRFQFPEEHQDKKGNSIKYMSPKGSGTFIYIPHKIREAYRTGQKIERLFVQEGEKKAEKACKHGIHSVGISGIQNLAKNGRIPEDLIRLIQKCEVKEIILLFDSDWNDISTNIKFNDNLEKRPRNFYTAAKNFRDYIRALKNRDISLEVYIGNVKKNELNDKGIDDLLANTLKDKENLLTEDIQKAIDDAKHLEGQYIQFYRIGGMPDSRLEELWNLNDPKSFAVRHKSILKNLREFKIGYHIWKFNENEEVVSAQPLEAYEQYWKKEDKTNKEGEVTNTTLRFAYNNCMNFLQNRGFFRFRRLDGSKQFIHIDFPTVRVVESYEIKDFVTEFTRNNKYLDVLELLIQGGSQYLGPEKLDNLIFQNPLFEESRRDQQLFYFQNTCWEITEKNIKEIDYTAIQHHIWSDQRNDFPARKIDIPLLDVTRSKEGNFDYTVSEIGKKSHFLQFLINASNFTWRQEKAGLPIEESELKENKNHLISKLSAIGYMLMTCKDRNVARTVVGMDGKQSTVGKSNGRSGKSLIGEMFKRVLPSVYINGKGDIEKDQFLWDEVTEKTKIVFIDDVRVNFSLEFLFACITGDWSVNYKGNRRITFPFTQSAKLYITTNHALNGEGSSFEDRQWKIAFSDYYNDKHKPLDDFGVLFFDEWDFDQWNLLWNLLASCVQLYLRYGVVQAPGEKIEARRLRQQTGETFIEWADTYFSNPRHLNEELPKKEMFASFSEDLTSKEKNFYTSHNFKSRLITYCELNGYILNPHKYDKITGLPFKVNKNGDPDVVDKRGGVEYFIVGTPDQWTVQANGDVTDRPETTIDKTPSNGQYMFSTED